MEELEAKLRRAELILRKFRGVELRALRIIRKYEELEGLLKERGRGSAV